MVRRGAACCRAGTGPREVSVVRGPGHPRHGPGFGGDAGGGCAPRPRTSPTAPCAARATAGPPVRFRRWPGRGRPPPLRPPARRRDVGRHPTSVSAGARGAGQEPGPPPGRPRSPRGVEPARSGVPVDGPNPARAAEPRTPPDGRIESQHAVRGLHDTAEIVTEVGELPAAASVQKRTHDEPPPQRHHEEGHEDGVDPRVLELPLPPQRPPPPGAPRTAPSSPRHLSPDPTAASTATFARGSHGPAPPGPAFAEPAGPSRGPRRASTAPRAPALAPWTGRACGKVRPRKGALTRIGDGSYGTCVSRCTRRRRPACRAPPADQCGRLKRSP